MLDTFTDTYVALAALSTTAAENADVRAAQVRLHGRWFDRTQWVDNTFSRDAYAAADRGDETSLASALWKWTQYAAGYFASPGFGYLPTNAAEPFVTGLEAQAREQIQGLRRALVDWATARGQVFANSSGALRRASAAQAAA